MFAHDFEYTPSSGLFATDRRGLDLMEAARLLLLSSGVLTVVVRYSRYEETWRKPKGFLVVRRGPVLERVANKPQRTAARGARKGCKCFAPEVAFWA